MSDERTNQERHDAARRGMADACHNALEQWDQSKGAMITGFLTVVEYLDSDGEYRLWWFTGTGAPSEGSEAGIPQWRGEGLARAVVRDIHSGNTRYANHDEDDD